jgi:hypothetical protein
MTTEPGDNPDLGVISGPPIAPSDAPDRLTRKAIQKAKTDANRPTLSQRLDSAVDRHVTEACSARDRLEEEKNRLQGDLNQLRGDLNVLAVEHQNLKNAHRFSVGANALSVVLLTIGSALVSTAGV